jgi:hypothetical protein
MSAGRGIRSIGKRSAGVCAQEGVVCGSDGGGEGSPMFLFSRDMKDGILLSTAVYKAVNIHK